VTLWLAVAGPDVVAASAAIEAIADAELSEAIPDAEVRRQATLVVDLDAEETTCPACLTVVPGGSSRCPSCRLRFA